MHLAPYPLVGNVRVRGQLPPNPLVGEGRGEGAPTSLPPPAGEGRGEGGLPPAYTLPPCRVISGIKQGPEAAC